MGGEDGRDGREWDEDVIECGDRDLKWVGVGVGGVFGGRLEVGEIVVDGVKLCIGLIVRRELFGVDDVGVDVV